MNPKAFGEKGESIVIGELAKWCIDVAIPISDNNPFDLILIIGRNLFKAQVKTTYSRTMSGSITFGLDTNNWYTGSVSRYTKEDCDVILCCDLTNYSLYLLSPSEFEDRNSFVIRISPPRNNQVKGCHLHENYVINKKRVKDVLGVDVQELSEHFNNKKIEYELTCIHCGKIFKFNSNWRKFCSSECRNSHLTRSTKKPPREELSNLLSLKTPWTRIGEKYGVSDNAVRKWARGYGII